MNLKYTLSDTIEWMEYDGFDEMPYKVHLKAEYWQLVIRMEILRVSIVNRDKIDEYLPVLKKQFDIMRQYKKILESRAEDECIDLDNDDVVIW